MTFWPVGEARQSTPVIKKNMTIDAEAVEQILSPSSLDGLVRLLNGARRSIDLELMTFSSKWGATGKISPLYRAVVEAARRGVKVRALLNDARVFQHPHGDRAKKDQNRITVKALNEVAKDEGLGLEARIADVKAMGVSYIHNKGALVDGKKVLVSSINWNQNSVENNREAALVLTSERIHAYYESLFEEDWVASEE
jgi:phosphatidylserine/phosphatidylglycerophosphate/cardiolipin synthase-like enzyme